MSKLIQFLDRWTLGGKRIWQRAMKKSPAEGFQTELNEELHRQVLKKIFHKPEFSIRDGMNEYDQNYSHFESLGDLVTHEMMREAERLADGFKQPDSGSEKFDDNNENIKRDEQHSA